jgi:hypothetical protein
VRLVVGDTATVGSDFCVDIGLDNASTGVQSVHATLVDVPDEFSLTGATCAPRAAGFSCSASETADNRILLSVDGTGAQCIASSTGAIARVCLHDPAPVCPVVSLVSLDVSDVTATDCAPQSLETCTRNGSIICEVLGDCNIDNGVIDIFDVLNKIDIIIEKVAPTSAESIVCDDTCDGAIDIFDVLQEIDAILGVIPQPLTCPQPLSLAPAAQPETVVPLEAEGSAASSARPAPTLSMSQNGPALILTNRDTPVRGIELTLTPEGGPVDVVDVRATRRSRSFIVAHHQANPQAPVRIVIVSSAGERLRPGRGTIATLKLRHTKGHGRLRLTDALVVP